jgi:sugar lactone lactonase YvrE
MPNQFLSEPQILTNSAAVSGNFTVGGILSASRVCSLNYTGNVVRSVAGKTGDVTLTLADVPGAPTPGNSSPSSLGSASPGALSTYARADHVHPASLTSTPALEDNSRNIASTEFVKSQAHTGNMCSSTPGGNSGTGSYNSAGNYRFALGLHSHPPDSTKIDVTGGTFTGAITGTQATFSYVSGSCIQGDGSLLRNVFGTDTTKMPLAGGTFTGPVVGTNACFNTLSGGLVRGDGSLLTNVFGTDVTKMPLAGGTFTGPIIGTQACFNTLSAAVLQGDGGQLRNVLGPAAILQLATYDVSNCASAAQQIGHVLGPKNNESLVIGYYSCSNGPSSVTLGNSAIGNVDAVTVGIAACAGLDSVAMGYNAKAAVSAIAIGQLTNARNNSTVIGSAAGACLDSISIGLRAQSSNCGLSIGNFTNSGGCGVAVGLYADGCVAGTALGAFADGSNQGVGVGVGACGEQCGVSVGACSCATDGGVAVGHNAKSNFAGVAIGRDSFSAQCGTALGHESCANDCFSVAVGYCSIAKESDTVIGTCALGAVSSVAIGEAAISSHAAISIGYQAKAATHAVAIGSLSEAICEGSVVVGDGIKATANNQILIGCGVESTSNNSTIIGFKAKGTAHGGTSVGTETIAGCESATVGSNSCSDGYSVAMGNLARSSNYSVALGYNSSAANESIAIGSRSSASVCSLAIGICINANTNSMSIGQNVNTTSSSTAIGRCSTACQYGTAFAEGSYAQKCSSAYGYNSLACTGSTSIGCGAWARCYGTVLGSNSGATTWGSIAIGPDAKIRGLCVNDVNDTVKAGFSIPSIPLDPSSSPLFNNTANSIFLDYCSFIHHAAVAKTINGSEVICDIGLGYNIDVSLFAPKTNVCGCGIPTDTVITSVYKDEACLGSPIPGQNNVNRAWHCDGRYRIVLSKVANASIDNTLLKFTHPFICYNDAAIDGGSSILSICSTSQEPLVGTYTQSKNLSIGAFGCMANSSSSLACGFESGLIDGYAPGVSTSTACITQVPTFPRQPRKIVTDNTGFAYIFEDDNSSGDLGAIRKVNLATGATSTIVGASVNSAASNSIGPIISRNQSSRYSTTTDGVYVYVTDSIDHVVFKLEIATGKRSGLTINNAAGINSGLSGISGFVGEIGIPYIFNNITGLTSAQYYAPKHINYVTDGAATPKRYLTFANSKRFPTVIKTDYGATTLNSNNATASELMLDGDFGPSYGFVIWDVEVNAAGVGLSVTPRASLSKVSRRGDQSALDNKTITEIVNLTRDPAGNIFVAARAAATPTTTYDAKNLKDAGTILSDLIIKIPAGTTAFLPANTYSLAKSSYAVSNNTAIHGTAYPNLRYPQQMTISPRTGELVIVDSNIHGDQQLGNVKGVAPAGTMRSRATLTTEGAPTSVYKVTQHGYKRLISPLRPTLPASHFGSTLSSNNLGASEADHRYGVGITMDNNDNIYISCVNNGTIHCLSAVALDDVYGNHSYIQIWPAFAGVGQTTVNPSWPTNVYNSPQAALITTFFQPRGLAVDSNARILYIADTGTNTIKRMNLVDRTVTLLAGALPHDVDGSYQDASSGSASRFKAPYGLALSSNGRYLYVTDTLNYRIRRVDTVTGATVTVAGNNNSGRIDGGLDSIDSAALITNESPRFLGPRGIAIKEISNTETHLYVTDTSIVGSPAVAANLSFNTPSGNPNVAPTLLNQGSSISYVRKLVLTTSVPRAGGVYDITRVRVSTLVGGTSLTDQINRGFGYYYPANPRTRLPAQRIGLYDANGISVDPSGNLYVSETANSTIRKISPDGLVLDYLGYSMALNNRPASAVPIVNSVAYPSTNASFNNARHPNNGDWFEVFSGRISGVNMLSAHPHHAYLKLHNVMSGPGEFVFYHNITQLTWGTQTNAASNQLYVLTSSPDLASATTTFQTASSHTVLGSSPTFWGWNTPAPANNSSGRYRNAVRMLNTGPYMNPHDGFSRTIVGSVNYNRLLDSRYGLYGSLVNCMGLAGLYKNAAFDGAGLNGLFLLDVSKDDKVGLLRRIDLPVSATRVYSLSTVYGNPYAVPNSTPINTTIANLRPVAIIDNLAPKISFSAPKYPIRDFAVVNSGNVVTQVYFSDTKNDVIRRYHTRSQVIETYAGVAGLPDEDHPFNPYINPITLKYGRTSSGLFATDRHLHGEVGTAGTNTPFDFADQGGVRPFAGGLLPFFNRPRGLTLNSNFDTLYVADSMDNAVKRINLTTNTISPNLAGSLSAIPQAFWANSGADAIARTKYYDFEVQSPSSINRIPSSLDLNNLRGNDSLLTINSLRFRSSGVLAPTYLSRTFASGNRKTWTWSAWVKRGTLSTTTPQVLFAPTAATPNSEFSEGYIYFGTDNTLVVSGLGAQIPANVFAKTTQTFTDTNTWYHIVVAMDTTQPVESDRLRIYVNGSIVRSFSTYRPLILNTDYGWNASVVHELGRGTSLAPTAAFDGYMTEAIFVDGLALPASSFGTYDYSTDAVLQNYKIWSPKEYSGSYGTNGFYLKFYVVASDIGGDSSGRGNNFTPTNIVSFSLTGTTGSSTVTELSGWDSRNGVGAFGNATLPASTDNTNAYRYSIAKATAVAGANAITLYFSRPIVATSKIEAYCYLAWASPGSIRANITGTSQTVPGVATGVQFSKVNLGVTTLTSITIGHGDTTAPRDFWLSCIIVDDVPVYTSSFLMALYNRCSDTPLNQISIANILTGKPRQAVGNFATLNPANGDLTNTSLSNGNLTMSTALAATTTGAHRYGNIPLDRSRNWYWEVTISDLNASGVIVGVTSDITQTTGATGINGYFSDGRKFTGGTGSAYGLPYSIGDVISVLLSTNGSLTFYKNGISQGVAFTGITGTVYPLIRLGALAARASVAHINFGQRPFAYTPLYESLPTPFGVVNSANFPADWPFTQSAVQARLFDDNPTPVTTGVLNLNNVGIGTSDHAIGSYGSLNKPVRLTLNTNTSAVTPWGAVAPDGILYVADSANNRVRKIFNPKGTGFTARLSTVAVANLSSLFLTSPNTGPIIDVSSDNTGRVYYARKQETENNDAGYIHYVERLNAAETSVETLFTSAVELYAIQSDPVGARVFVSGSTQDTRLTDLITDESQIQTSVWNVNTGDKSYFDLYRPNTETNPNKTIPTAIVYDMELEKATVGRNLAMLVYDGLVEGSTLSNYRNNLTYARLKIDPGYKMKIGMLVEGFVFGNANNLFAPNTYITSILDETRVALSKPFPGAVNYTSTGTSRLTARFQQTDYRFALPIQLTTGSDIMTLTGIGLSSVVTSISALRVGDYLADILVPQYVKIGKKEDGTLIPLDDTSTTPASYQVFNWPGTVIEDYFGTFPENVKDEGDGKVHPVVITQVINRFTYRLSRVAIKSSPPAQFITGYFTPGAGIAIGQNATTTLNTSLALGSNSNPLALEPGATAAGSIANYLRVTVNGKDYMMPLYNIPN